MCFHERRLVYGGLKWNLILNLELHFLLHLMLALFLYIAAHFLFNVYSIFKDFLLLIDDFVHDDDDDTMDCYIHAKKETVCVYFLFISKRAHEGGRKTLWWR